MFIPSLLNLLLYRQTLLLLLLSIHSSRSSLPAISQQRNSVLRQPQVAAITVLTPPVPSLSKVSYSHDAEGLHLPTGDDQPHCLKSHRVRLLTEMTALVQI